MMWYIWLDKQINPMELYAWSCKDFDGSIWIKMVLKGKTLIINEHNTRFFYKKIIFLPEPQFS